MESLATFSDSVGRALSHRLPASPLPTPDGMGGKRNAVFGGLPWGLERWSEFRASGFQGDRAGSSSQ